jgi:predicted nucleic acid-binding protein
VLDCSVAVSWCFEDEASPATDDLLDRVRDEGAIVPALWRWEVANVLLVGVRRGRLSAGDASARLSLIDTLSIAQDADASEKAWRETFLLAQTHALSAYDAAYLELALRLGADLATKDADLRRAATGLGVKVVP